MDTLGIDIGTVSVKYVRYRKKGRVVVSRGEYPYREAWEDLNGVLAEIKAREGTNVEVAVGITSQEILKKAFTIPVIPKEELKDVLDWSASKSVSIPLDDMRYEYVMMGEVDERGVRKEEVLFVGAHREYINRIMALFEDAGFKDVVLITDIGFTYLPMVQETIEGSVAIVDIGGRQTGIYVFDNKRMRLIREIMTASESFTDVLISGFGLSTEEAERYKRENGFDETASDILAVPLERLGGEIQRTFNVYAQKFPSRPVAKVYITGRGALIPNLLEKLKTFLVEEVAYLPPQPDIEDEFAPAYVLASQREGLTNLLPERVKAREREVQYTKYARIAGVAVLSILVILSLDRLASLNKVKTTLDSEKGDIAKKKEQLDRLGAIRSSLVYTELGPVVAEIEKKDPSLVVLLKYLSSRISKEIFLREISFDGPSEAPPAPAPSSSSSAAPPAKAPTGPPANQPPQSAPRPTPGTGMSVTLKGYIFGDVENMESELLRLLINLEKSGIVSGVMVTTKDIKEFKGRNAMEFVITGKSTSYEI